MSTEEKTWFQISYIDAKTGNRHRYMNMAFHSEEKADQEFERIKVETKKAHRYFGTKSWVDRKDYALEKLENKIRSFVKYYSL